MAFRGTCLLLERHAEHAGEKLYFWRFSTTEQWVDWKYSYMFAPFMRDVCHHYDCESPLFGVRVVEIGARGTCRLHYHAILNKRIPIGLFDRIGPRYGFGYSYVKPVTSMTGLIKYLTPYLSKKQPRDFSSKIARWRCIGGFEGVRLKDIEWETRYTEAFRSAKRILGRDKLNRAEVRAIVNSPHNQFPGTFDYLVRHYKVHGDVDILIRPLWWVEQEFGDLDARVPLTPF